MKNPSIRSSDLKILAVACLYYLSAELGFLLAFDDSTSMPFWPPAGIALAMIVLYGRSVWPGIAIGSLIISVKNFWFGSIESSQLIILVSTLITAGRIIEPIVGDLLLKKLINRANPFSKTLHAFQFVFVVLTISLISSGVSAVTLDLASVLSPGEFVQTMFSLWMRNVVGIMLFTPIILALAHVNQRQFTLRKLSELVVIGFCFAAVFLVFHAEVLKGVFAQAMPFVVIPFLLWLAFRFNSVVHIAGYICASLVSIYFTSQNIGPFFVGDSILHSITLMQVYICVISISTLVLGSAVAEREKIQDDLRQFNENLENMVSDRTKALKEEIKSRNEAQLKLQQTNDELTKRNTELDNFVYSVSHDLRAPISSILGLINLAKKDKAHNVKTLYLEMIEKSAKQQDYFIREILDQSRNARLEVKREPIQFKTLIEETFEQFKYPDSESRMETVIHVDQKEPFYTDKWRLKVILNNLISNSIRYKNGKDAVIKIDAKITGHVVNLSVEDNGKGISQEHLPNLGKMFYRATDEGAGSGLGLYIVKEALGRLNGSMDITSKIGSGTTVNLAIPEAMN